MRHLSRLYLLLIVVPPICVQGAPAPKRQDAKPAIIDAGNEGNIVGVLANLSAGRSAQHRAPIHEEKVAKLAIVCQEKDALGWLGKNLRVERIEGTNLVRISLRVGSPGEQATIVNAVVDQYLEEVGRTRDSLTRSLEMVRIRREDILARWAKLTAKGRPPTPEQLADMEKGKAKLKKDEEYIRVLPALVEHAKVR